MMVRSAKIARKTNETQIEIELNLDGEGKATVDTGVPFMDHMLDLFLKHGLYDGVIKANGDTHIDDHHTTEDLGIVLGQVIREALGDKKGIRRYGHAFVPMDDALALCAVDLCGRPYFSFDCDFTVEKVGYLDTELVREFFYAVSYSAGMNLHIKMLSGINNHHMIEAMFKAFARALDEAVSLDSRVTGLPSTKGAL